MVGPGQCRVDKARGLDCETPTKPRGNFALGVRPAKGESSGMHESARGDRGYARADTCFAMGGVSLLFSSNFQIEIDWETENHFDLSGIFGTIPRPLQCV